MLSKYGKGTHLLKIKASWKSVVFYKQSRKEFSILWAFLIKQLSRYDYSQLVCNTHSWNNCWISYFKHDRKFQLSDTTCLTHISCVIESAGSNIKFLIVTLMNSCWQSAGWMIKLFFYIREVNFHLNLVPSNYTTDITKCSKMLSYQQLVLVLFRRFSLSTNGWQEDCKFTSGRIQDA